MVGEEWEVMGGGGGGVDVPVGWWTAETRRSRSATRRSGRNASLSLPKMISSPSTMTGAGADADAGAGAVQILNFPLFSTRVPGIFASVSACVGASRIVEGERIIFPVFVDVVVARHCCSSASPSSLSPSRSPSLPLPTAVA